MDHGPDLQNIGARLTRCADVASALAANAGAGREPSPETLDSLVALLTGIRLDVAGPGARPEGSARDRILRYFEQREGEVVHADEIAAVAGIHAWARRIRELRDAGHPIEHLGAGRYVMHRAV